MMNHLILKALHIIGFVSWFAGLFYWLRIFVYLAESTAESSPKREILFEQFAKMENRVYSIIVIPGLVLTLVFGVSMLILNPVFLSQPWMHVKLGCLFLLILFQFYMKKKINAYKIDPKGVSFEYIRILNEVPTVFLLIIVLLAVIKNQLSALAAFVAIVAFMMLLMFGIKFYKRYRINNPNH